MNNEILKLLNSKTGRYLLGIKHNFPIVRFSKEWIECWTGTYKNGKPVMKTTVWVSGSNFVERRILTSYQKIKITEREHKPIKNKEEAFLHFSGLELNRKYPQVYLLTTTKNPDTGEAQIHDGPNTSWATIRGDASGADTSDQPNITNSLYAPNYHIRRTFAPFNTSTLGNILVSAADIQFYRDDTISAFLNVDVTSVQIVPSQQASGTAIALSDYSKLTFTGRGSIALSATVNAAYNTMAFTNFSEISGSSYTKYALIGGLDLNNTVPTGANEVWFQNRAAANPIKLDLTYIILSGFLNFM